jgi:hypothetical protein
MGIDSSEKKQILESEAEKPELKEENSLSEKKKRIYKEGQDKVMRIAEKYNIDCQILIAQGHTDVGKFILYDSKWNMTDMRQMLLSDEKLSPEQREMLAINLALMNIPRDESLILYNDFFFPSAKKWWIDAFSRSVYYRLKKNAVARFLSVYSLWEKYNSGKPADSVGFQLA